MRQECLQTLAGESRQRIFPDTSVYVFSYYYMCPDTTINVSSHYCTCPHTTMCPHTTTYGSACNYVSSYYYMCPHTKIYVLVPL
jgi:hypothetical protein